MPSTNEVDEVLRDGDLLQGSYAKHSAQDCYIAVVARQRDKELTIVAVGVEGSEFAALEWIRETVKSMRTAGRTDLQAPDMIDRAGIITKDEGRV